MDQQEPNTNFASSRENKTQESVRQWSDIVYEKTRPLLVDMGEEQLYKLATVLQLTLQEQDENLASHPVPKPIAEARKTALNVAYTNMEPKTLFVLTQGIAVLGGDQGSVMAAAGLNRAVTERLTNNKE